MVKLYCRGWIRRQNQILFLGRFYFESEHYGKINWREYEKKYPRTAQSEI